MPAMLEGLPKPGSFCLSDEDLDEAIKRWTVSAMAIAAYDNARLAKLLGETRAMITEARESMARSRELVRLVSIDPFTRRDELLGFSEPGTDKGPRPGSE